MPMSQSNSLFPALKQGVVPRLLVLFGQDPCRKYTLRDEVIVGRAEICDVRLRDSKASRQHLRIEPRGGEWRVVDLDSRNGTIVNGESVRMRKLQFGDRIQVGHSTLIVFTRVDPLEELLTQRQQMEVIGRLAAGVAHDFNNLLSVVTASASRLEELLEARRPDIEQALECVRDARVAAMRGAELTTRVLMSTRSREAQEAPAVVDVSALCQDVVKLAERTFRRRVEVRTDVAPELHTTGFRAELHQAMMNLLVNARDAMPEGGRLAVYAGVDPEDPQRLLLQVSDTGVGMSPETKAQMFEPFFTTKGRGAGSGLGLTTVHQVIAEHGGTVDVDTEPRCGTTFRIQLPRVEGGHAMTEDGQQSADAERGPERALSILVADDQELVRRALGRLLSARGHRVSYADDGEAALELYRASEPPPDVVILDVDMPHLSGPDCLRGLRDINPNVRVVLITGYFHITDRSHLRRAGAVEVLSKPTEPADLYRAIRIATQDAPAQTSAPLAAVE